MTQFQRRSLPAALALSFLYPGLCRAADAAGEAPVIAAVTERIAPLIAAHEIAGAVTVVATPDGIAHRGVAGLADIDAKRPMRPDTIFRIASMTKPITATAVLMLQDAGKLSVDDPVERYIPEFARLKNSRGEPARLTIRHLLTHTSGLSEAGGSPETLRSIKTLAELIPLFASKPLRFDPGTKWVYCQSGINTAARVVEVASGENFADFLDYHIFGPLGMKDTTFYPDAEQIARLATTYRREDDGTLKPAPISGLMGNAPTGRNRYPAANGGLFSTAGDYARFCRMILREGESDGKRYLKPESVKLMTTLQSGELKTGFTPGCGWGLGWCVVRKPEGVTAMLAPGSFGHGGAYGTQAWIDPVAKRAYILMVQRANFPNADASEVRRGFQEAAAAAR